MKSPLEQNYYELLEVPRDGTLAEIDRAYERARAYYGQGSTSASRPSTSNGLARQVRTPKARRSSAVCGRSCAAEVTTIGTSSHARLRRHSSTKVQPSMIGIIRSSTIRSGRRSPTASSASTPLLASET